MNIAISSDHAGVTIKSKLVDHLKSKGHTVKDFGPFTDESVDYPDFAHPLAQAVEKGEYKLGFTLCGSGNGISIAANKHQGIRAALCWNKEITALARQHNDANICSLPARFITTEEAIEFADIFVETSFEGGRHQRRVEKIDL